MVQFFATFEVSIQALELKPKGQKSPEPSHVEALVTFGSFLGMWEAFTLSQLGQARGLPRLALPERGFRV